MEPASAGAQSTHDLVRETLPLVENMEILREDARRLYRFMKRTEVLVGDLRPYIAKPGSDPRLASASAHMEAELAAIKRMLEDCAAKGKLAAYMQADHMLASFTAAARHMDAALAAIPLGALPAARDTVEDIGQLRAALQKAVFELPAEHTAALRVFRAACDEVRGHAAALEDKVKDVLVTIGCERNLTRAEYSSCVADLVREVRTLRAYAVAAAAEGPSAARAAMGLRAPGAGTKESAEASAYYLRVLLDVIRVAFADVEEENVPLEFLCPLSTLIMHDPVVLMESGHSFERQALEDWWANGHRMCPKTGVPLRAKTLMVAPNVQLKECIHRWAEAADQALRFRPLLRLLSTASDSNNMLQAAQRAASGALPAAAVAAATAALGRTGVDDGLGPVKAVAAAGMPSLHVSATNGAPTPAPITPAAAYMAAPAAAAAPAPAAYATPINPASLIAKAPPAAAAPPAAPLVAVPAAAPAAPPAVVAAAAENEAAGASTAAPASAAAQADGAALAQAGSSVAERLQALQAAAQQ